MTIEQELGAHIIDAADKLRLFIPDHIAKFPFTYRGKRYEITLTIKDD